MTGKNKSMAKDVIAQIKRQRDQIGMLLILSMITNFALAIIVLTK